MALSTMRISYPPVRFDNPVYSVRSRRVVLKPFEGQPKKWGGVFRLPEGVLELSGIKDAGMGFKLKEDVREGGILSIYARNIISEANAEILKAKVCGSKCRILCLKTDICLNSCRIVIFVITVLRAVA